jgi:hypothetical protein
VYFSQFFSQKMGERREKEGKEKRKERGERGERRGATP